MFNKFYRAKDGIRYIYLRSTHEAVAVYLAEPFKIDIENDKSKICDSAAMLSFHPNFFDEITYAQFYSVLFEAIEHIKEFIPDKNKDIFEPHVSTDFAQDHDYGDEETGKEWWASRGVV